jgi:hypothetical protein
MDKYMPIILRILVSIEGEDSLLLSFYEADEQYAKLYRILKQR